MEDKQKMETGLPELIELEQNKDVEIKEKTIQHDSSQKKIRKNNKIEASKNTDSLSDLVLKNIKLSEAIFIQNKKIKRRLNLMLLGGYLKMVLIVAPLIFAVIYLGPFINQLLAQYNSLLGGSGGGTSNLGSMLDLNKFGINSILSNVSSQDAAKLQEMLKNVSK